MNLLPSLLFVLMLNFILVVCQKGASKSQIIWSLLRRYDRNEPPMPDRPTEVKVGIHVNSFYSISELSMDYAVNVHFRQAWTDRRLAFTPPDRNTTTLQLDGSKIGHFWIPDTFFRNEKRASFHYVTVTNKFIKINARGRVWYVTKISARLSCPMRLQNFPFDTQVCPLTIESFTNTMDTLYYSWMDNAFDMDAGTKHPAFTLKDVKLNDCSQNYTSGAYPCLNMGFVLKRDVGYFISQLYFPSIVVVILSWVPFWINTNAVTARVMIGAFMVLAACIQSVESRSALPRISYLTAMDVWMFMCLIFVFAALTEVALTEVISSQETKADEEEAEQSKVVKPNGKQRAGKIDRLARVVFPLVFLAFNIIYWPIYNV